MKKLLVITALLASLPAFARISDLKEREVCGKIESIKTHKNNASYSSASMVLKGEEFRIDSSEVVIATAAKIADKVVCVQESSYTDNNRNWEEVVLILK